jgi:hypothetical protein
MMMKKSVKAVTVFLGVMVLIAFVYSASLAAEQVKSRTTQAPAAVPPANSTIPLKVCADPAVSLVLTKMLTGDMAMITMQATVCNKGGGDYVGQMPLDANFYVITWHPPKTAAQESDWKSISHVPVSAKLAKGECKTLIQRYTITGVTMWGHAAAMSAGRPAVKELGVSINKQYPMQSGVGFSAKENCKTDNDVAFETVMYMEKI